MSIASKINGPGDNPWDVNFEDLENLRDLSSGNFGKVFRGSYFGTEVAVKKLLDVDDEFMHKYIEREMAILKSLRHPNIVQFMGLSKHHNDYFIVTEFIPGGDLRHLLKDVQKDVSWKVRAKMALDTAQALTYLHSKGLIHRDLKSHNLLVENGKIKLCDFGFSRRVGDGAEPMTLCGTDEWMAPEVMLGEKYDARADVFSFGMVITELVTRQKPAKRSPGRKFAFDADAFRAQVPKGCPPEFVSIAIDCTQWDALQRPQSKDIMERLKTLHGAMPDDPPSPGAPKKSASSSADLNYGTVVAEEDGGSNHAEKKGKNPSPKDSPKKEEPKPRERHVKSDAPGKSGKMTRDTTTEKGEFTVKKGATVTLVGLDDERWMKIESHGKTGWIPQDNVEVAKSGGGCVCM